MYSKNPHNLITAFISNFYYNILLNQKNKSRLLAEKFKNDIEKALSSSYNLFSHDICDNTGYLTISIEKNDMNKILTISDSVTQLMGVKAESLTKNTLDNLFPKQLNYHYSNFIQKILEVELKANPFYDFPITLIDNSGYLHIWNTRARYSVNFMDGFNLLFYFTGLNTVSIADVTNFITKYEETMVIDKVLNIQTDFYICFNEFLNFEYVDPVFAKMFNLNHLELSTLNLHSIIGGIPEQETMYKFFSTHINFLRWKDNEQHSENENNEVVVPNLMDDTNKYKLTVVDQIETASGKMFFGIISQIKSQEAKRGITRSELQSEVSARHLNDKSKIANKNEDAQISQLKSHSKIVRISKLILIILLLIDIAGGIILLLITNNQVFNKDVKFSNKQIYCKSSYDFLYKIHFEYQHAYLGYLVDNNFDLNSRIEKIKSNIQIYEDSVYDCFNYKNVNVDDPESGYLISELPSHTELINMLNSFDFVQPNFSSVQDNLLVLSSYVFNNTDVSQMMIDRSTASREEPILDSEKIFGLFSYAYFLLLSVYLIYFAIYIKLHRDMRRIVLQSFTTIDTKKLLSLIPVYQQFISRCLTLDPNNSITSNKQSHVINYQNLKEKTLKSLHNYNFDNVEVSNASAATKRQALVSLKNVEKRKILIGYSIFKHKQFFLFIIALAILFAAYYLSLANVIAKYRTLMLTLNTMKNYVQAENNNMKGTLVLSIYGSIEKVKTSSFPLMTNEYINSFYNRLVEQDSEMQKMYKEKFENDKYVFNYFQTLMNTDLCLFIGDNVKGEIDYESSCNYGFNTIFKNYISKVYEIRIESIDFFRNSGELYALMDKARLMDHLFNQIITFLFEYFKNCTAKIRALQITFTVLTVLVLLFCNISYLIFVLKKIKKEEKVDRHLVVTHEKYLGREI